MPSFKKCFIVYSQEAKEVSAFILKHVIVFFSPGGKTDPCLHFKTFHSFSPEGKTDLCLHFKTFHSPPHPPTPPSPPEAKRSLPSFKKTPHTQKQKRFIVYPLEAKQISASILKLFTVYPPGSKEVSAFIKKQQQQN